MKNAQVKRFGNVVALIRCQWHGEGRRLNVAVDGEIDWSPQVWEHLFIPDHNPQDELQYRQEFVVIHAAAAGQRYFQ